MKYGTSLSIALASAFLLMPTFAMSQVSMEPKNGDLLRIDHEHFWQFSLDQELRVDGAHLIASDMDSPSISPDGKRVVFHRKADAPGLPAKLFQWADDQSQTQLLREDMDVSNYVTWTDNDRFFMREQSAPFFEHGKKLNFAVEGRQSHFKNRRAINENAVLVYQAEDAIFMKRENILQIISDVTIDRYFSPIVSSDESFIVFVGLASGVNLFDISQNAVVFQDALGAYPSFSPDGRYLVYTQAKDDGHVITQADTVLVDLHTHKVMHVANPNKEIRIRATVSRDASFIAYETITGDIFRAKLSK